MKTTITVTRKSTITLKTKFRNVFGFLFGIATNFILVEY